jgi:hypothetical protein
MVISQVLWRGGKLKKKKLKKDKKVRKGDNR